MNGIRVRRTSRRQTFFAGLSQLIQNSDHEFWPDEISLLDRSRFDPEAIFGHKQLTDIYLLGLAMHKRGKFITFDQRVYGRRVPGTNERESPDSLIVGG